MVNRRGRDEREGEGASRQACTWSPASRRSSTRSPARRKVRRAAVERTGTSGMSGVEERALGTGGGEARAPRAQICLGRASDGPGRATAKWGARVTRGAFPLAAGVLRGGGWPPGWRQVAGTRWPAVEIEERRWEAAG